MSGREIKFRVWLKTCKRIENVLRISYGDPTLIRHESGLNTINDVELLQLTGLKYRTGEEMMEGDIVLYDRNIHEDIDSMPFIVIWDNEKVKFTLKSEQGEEEIDIQELEKIGNIYENPELL